MPRKIVSPPSFQQEEHYLHPNPHPNPHLYHRIPHPVKHETPAVTTTIMTPSSLKVNRDSHVIKKSSSGTLNSSFPNAGSNGSNKSNQQQQQQQQQRGPVIIYTHSPKVIHTNPRDFMALVQKLTGMSRNDEAGTTSKPPQSSSSSVPNNNNLGNVEEGSRCIDVPNDNNNNNSTDDNESSSITTDENCSSSNNTTGGDVVGKFNPYMSPQLFDLQPPPPSLPLPSPPSSNLPPLYMPSSSDGLCYVGDSSIYDYVDVNFPFDQIT